MARGSVSRSRSRGRRGGGHRSRSRGRRDRERSRSRDRGRRDRSRSRSAAPAKRRRSRSKSASRRRPRSPSQRRRSHSRSKSHKPRRRSRTPERVPPTSFADYEASPDGSGWYVYKKIGKWKYHPETGLYLHIKSGVYYVQKEGDAKAFRKIEDEDDPTIRKMKQSEEMRKAIQSTEFVQFDAEAAAAAAADGSGKIAPPPGPPAAPQQVVVSPPPEAHAASAAAPAAASGVKDRAVEVKPQEQPAGDERTEGKVREWSAEKGFGFIVPIQKEGEQEGRSIFVHLWNVVGSSHSNPINLREGARVQFTLGEQDGRPRALEVVMLGKDSKPLPVHAGAQTLEEKRKSYYVTAESLGVRVHAESWPGKQLDLRDRYASDEPMQELGVYFGAFDGHGGSQVSEIASKQLHKNILANFRSKQVQPASRDEKIKGALREAFIQTDKEILGLSERKKFDASGSTALVALLHGNPKLGTPLRLVLAHVGNSRAVLCRAGLAVVVTEDHTPDRLDERKRVEREGGLVLNVRGAWRIAAPANPGGRGSSREYKGLALTRSFGDLAFKTPRQMSIPDPEVKVLPLTEKDLFLVLGTDGIYSVLSNQEVVDLASRHWQNPEEAAKAIVRAAFQQGSDDNLTAVVIQFGWTDKGAAKYIETRRAAVARGLDGDSPKHKPSAIEPVSKPVDDDFDMFG